MDEPALLPSSYFWDSSLTSHSSCPLSGFSHLQPPSGVQGRWQAEEGLFVGRGVGPAGARARQELQPERARALHANEHRVVSQLFFQQKSTLEM